MTDVFMTKEEGNSLTQRLDRHESRLQALETAFHNLDKEVAVITNKLDRVLELVTGISITVRNTLITMGIGAIVWAVVQMAT